MLEGWIAVGVAIVGGILIPLLVMSIRASTKAGRNEEKLDSLVDAKDKTYQMLNQLIRDMDVRIRWLEENTWRGNRPPTRR